MTELDERLQILIDEYLRGTLTLSHVENWLAHHVDAAFGSWESRLVETLEVDLAEMVTGGLTESQVQADLREVLSSRPIPGLLCEQAGNGTSAEQASSANNTFVVSHGPANEVGSGARTGFQLAFG